MMRAYILKMITLDRRLWINFKEVRWKQKEQLFQGRDDAWELVEVQACFEGRAGRVPDALGGAMMEVEEPGIVLSDRQERATCL